MISWTVFDLVTSKEEKANQETVNQENTMFDEGGGYEETGLVVGDIAPDFELTTLEGKTVRLSDYRGQSVFINF